MPTRRRLLGLFPVVLMTACSQRTSSRATQASSTSGTLRRLTTALGDVELVVSDGSIAAWEQTVTTAARRVADVWGRASRSVHVAVVADDEWATSADGLDANTAAITTSKGRVVIAATAAGALTSEGRVVVAAHELTHVRLGHYGSDRTAMWLKEGVAEWAATPRNSLAPRQRWPNLVRAHTRDPSAFTTAPAGADFTRDAALSYEWAAAYVAYLVEASGVPALKKLVAAHPQEDTAQQAASRSLPAQTPAFRAWLDAALAD